MTGNAADADDLVQETFVRALERPPRTSSQPLRPWLIRVAVNLSKDLLRKRKRRRYLGEWLPSPVPTEQLESPFSYEPAAPSEESPASRYELLESVSFAFLLALEALTPNQRAVLLLRDVFDYSTEETAEALDLSEANAKVLLLRARRKMGEYDKKRQRPSSIGITATRRVLERFLDYLGRGDTAGLEQLFAEDAVSTSDGGGQVHAAMRRVIGRERVLKLILGLSAKLPRSPQATIIDLNGAPAILYQLGPMPAGNAEWFTMHCTLDDSGQIRRLDTVLAPTKLSALRTVPTKP
jgi:RNA polymerase sigma-70 factor (ECF subfamily)